MDKISKIPKVQKKGHKSPPKGYPKDGSMYADSKNFKYPLDTEKHVRAALAYLSEAKNQKGYSSSELKTMFGRIHSRCKDFGIEVHKEEKKAIMRFNLMKIALLADDLDGLGMYQEAEEMSQILNEIIKTL